MYKKKVSVVITDLDNTLYDWFGVWFSSFNSMLDVLVNEFGIARGTLIPEIQKIHEKYNTSEYLMLLKEIPILSGEFEGKNKIEIFKKAVDAYKIKREELLHLYPTVYETLVELKKRGCLIVGYTDSQTLYTDYRIKKLNLDGVIDFLYSSPTHEFDEKNHSETEHFFPSQISPLQYTTHLQTPKDTSKPSPEVLISIIKDIGVSPYEVVYIGDSKFNDISMAKAVPVTDVYAEYGDKKNEDNYELLKQVTHWNLQKVNDEKVEIVPTFTLKQSFAEILDLFNFVLYKKPSLESEATLSVDIWKKTIDVQQHFNDLELRIRNFAFTILGIIISASAVAYKEYETAYLSWVLVLVGLVIWLMFFMMDFFWYHRLLIGSVKHGTKIEEMWKRYIPALGLTSSISEHSPIVTRRGKRWGSNKRMAVFYLTIAGLQLLLATGFFIAWLTRKPAEKKDSNPVVNVINNSQSPINTEVINTNINSNTNNITSNNSNSGNNTNSGNQNVKIPVEKNNP